MTKGEKGREDRGKEEGNGGGKRRQRGGEWERERKKRRKGKREEGSWGRGKDSTGMEKPGSQSSDPAINGIPAAPRTEQQRNHLEFLTVENKLIGAHECKVRGDDVRDPHPTSPGPGIEHRALMGCKKGAGGLHNDATPEAFRPSC